MDLLPFAVMLGDPWVLFLGCFVVVVLTGFFILKVWR